MEAAEFILIGFARLLTPENMAVLIAGIATGMTVGVMPGLGIVNGIVLALPFTYRMGVEPSIILLTAIYMAGTYGGCFTAILYRIPGESNDIPLLWDGYRMARNGAATKALGWALVAALTGGLVSTGFMVGLAAPLGQLALSFGPPDYFAAVLFGLATVVSLAGSSIMNAVIGLLLGLLISTIGVDSIYGAHRFTFDTTILANGVPYLAVLMGMYGVGEVLTRMGQPTPQVTTPAGGPKRLGTSLPSLAELWELRGTFLRSTTLGTLLGMVPGAGATVTSFISYGIEKQYGKRGDRLGTGLPEGVVAPQIGSTASVAGHMVPLLTLGLPGSGATAVILAAFLLHGVQPGPFLFSKPESTAIAYTIFVSMFATVAGMCLLSIVWIHLTVLMLRVPTALLDAFIVMLCLLGIYADRNNVSDIWMVVIFGGIGYLFERYAIPISPLVLGVILGPLAESSFMQSMISYDNDWTVFVRGPIRGTLVALTVLALAHPIWKRARPWIKRVFGA